MKYIVTQSVRGDDVRDVVIERVCENCGCHYGYQVRIDPRSFPGKMTRDKFEDGVRYIRSVDGQEEYGVWCPHCHHVHQAAIQRAFPHGLARAVREYRWREADIGSFVFFGIGGCLFLVAGICEMFGIKLPGHEPSAETGIAFVIVGIGLLLHTMQTTKIWSPRSLFNKRLARRARQVSDSEFNVLLSRICRQYLYRETPLVSGGVYQFNHPFSHIVAQWPQKLCFDEQVK